MLTESLSVIMLLKSRTPQIMADAAYTILCQPTSFTGNFCIDDELLEKMHGIKDFKVFNHLFPYIFELLIHFWQQREKLANLAILSLEILASARISVW